MSLSKAKLAATKIEERYCRIRRESFAVSGKLSSKNLESGILKSGNLGDIQQMLAPQPTSVLLKQDDIVLKNMVYISNCSRNLKDNFVRALRLMAKKTKTVALEPEVRTRRSPASGEDCGKIARLEEAN